MSSFNWCCDEDLEAVFSQLEFPTKYRLRRCCRRWDHRLRSGAHLRSLIFTVTSEPSIFQIMPLLTNFQAVLPHVINVALNGHTSYKFRHKNPADITVDAIWELVCFMPVAQHHERRLYLVNFDGPTHYLRAVYERASFNWTEVRNMTLTGEWLLAALSAVLWDDLSFDARKGFLPLRQSDPTGLAGPAIQHSGGYTLKSPRDVTGVDVTGREHVVTKSIGAALFGFVRAHTRHLSQQETADMLERLRGYDED